MGDFDLQHFGIHQVFRRHTETAGGHLLDLRALHRAVTGRIFAALTGVGARAQTVHRFGNGFVGFRRQGAEGNPGRIEALEDHLQRLDLIQRQRLLGQLDLQQVADHRHRTGVDQRGVFLEFLVAALLHSGLQGIDHVRVVGVVLATVNKLEQTTLLDRLAVVPGFGGQQLLLGFNVDETRTLDAASHTTEAQLDHFVGQAHGFEQLRTTVRGDGGDAHLRQDLQQALGNALAVVLEHFIQIAQHFAGANQVGQHFIGQERVHGRSTETHQHGEVMRIAGGGGFYQDVAVAPQTFLGQAMVHGTGHQRGMGRQFAWSNVTVGQNQQGLAGAHSFFSLIRHSTYGRFQPQGFVVVHVDDMTLEAGLGEVHQRAPLGRRNHRRGEDHTTSVGRRLFEDVAFGTQADFQRHHDRFTQRVDRRVGDLGKLLAEVVEGRAHAL